MGLTERQIFRQLGQTARRLEQTRTTSTELAANISQGNYPAVFNLGSEIEQPWQQRLESLTRVVTLQERLRDEVIPGFEERLAGCQQLTVDLQTAIQGRRTIRVAVREGLLPPTERQFINGVIAGLKQQALDQRFVRAPMEIIATRPEVEAQLASVEVVEIPPVKEEGEAKPKVPELLLPAFPILGTISALRVFLQRPEARREALRFLTSDHMPYFIDRMKQFFANDNGTQILLDDFLTVFFGHAFERVAHETAVVNLSSKFNKPPFVVDPLQTANTFLIAHPFKPQIKDHYGFPDGVLGMTTPDGIIIAQDGSLSGGVESTAANLNTTGGKVRRLGLQISKAPTLSNLRQMLGVDASPGLGPNEALRYLMESIPGIPSTILPPGPEGFQFFVVRPFDKPKVPHFDHRNVFQTEVDSQGFFRLCEGMVMDARKQYNERGDVDPQTFLQIPR